MRVTPKIGGGVDIGVENFVVEQGTITYRNAVRGIDERVDGLGGQVSFASLKGPVDASIRATIHGLPIAIEVSAGEVIQGRTVPFNLDATVAPGGIKAQFAGSLTGLDEAALRFRGRLTAEGLDLAEFSNALGLRDVPDTLRRPFGIQTNIIASGEGAELADLTL